MARPRHRIHEALGAPNKLSRIPLDASFSRDCGRIARVRHLSRPSLRDGMRLGVRLTTIAPARVRAGIQLSRIRLGPRKNSPNWCFTLQARRFARLRPPEVRASVTRASASASCGGASASWSIGCGPLPEEGEGAETNMRTLPDTRMRGGKNRHKRFSAAAIWAGCYCLLHGPTPHIPYAPSTLMHLTLRAR